jgi:hypothetical protein
MYLPALARHDNDVIAHQAQKAMSSVWLWACTLGPMTDQWMRFVAFYTVLDECILARISSKHLAVLKSIKI